MKKIDKPSVIFKWKGELVKVISIANERSVCFQAVDAVPCEKCGQIKQYDIIEMSPLFQENAEPVDTLTP